MSVVALSSSVLKHSWRSVRSGGLPFFFAVMMTTLGLFSVTVFGTVLWNFERIARSIGESVAAVVFLDDGMDARAAEETRARIQLLPGVGAANLISPEEGLERARRGLGDSGRALQGAEGVTMPWAIEVLPSWNIRADATRDTLAQRLASIGGIDEVMHPGGEVERIQALLGLLHGAAIFLLALVSLVVIVVVSNAVKLMVLVRREEIAIQKLVGASDFFVAAPLWLSGLVQGGGGGLLAVLSTWIAHASLARVVRTALSGSLGTFVLDPLPARWLVLVVVAGALLGAIGAAVSAGRWLRT